MASPPNGYPDPRHEGLATNRNGTGSPGEHTARGAEHGQQRPPQSPNVPLFGARRLAREQSQQLSEAYAEIQRLRAQLATTGGFEVTELQRLRDQLGAQVTEQQTRLDNLRAEIVNTREEHALQEIGIFEYRHRLSDAVAYRGAIEKLQGEIKAMARRDGGAIESLAPWVVNESVTDGRKMVREYSTLMLRAYNAEVDNLIRNLKPHNRDNALNRLNKINMTFEKLGKTTKLRVAPDYHRLRCRELDMTAEYLEVLARQKDHERAERDRLREDRRAQEELARERAKLEKEQRLYSNQLNALRAAGSSDGADADDLQERLEALEQAISTIDYRASNLRAGYVYVISNIGAFGDRVVQIGLTRRFDPNERIRELGNTAVPFRYDIHAMFFADDATGIEEEMHRRLADKRVNKVNQRREFFYATPTEVREHLESLTGELVDFKEIAEAVEYRQSRTARDNTPQ